MKITLSKLAVTIALLLFLCPLTGICQDKKDVIFYNTISDDSVVMFFNAQFNFTEAYCASFKRYTKVDKNGDFFQAFVDSSRRNLLGKGYYLNGVKNGHFQIFFDNGIVMCEGDYKNNIRDGIWKFYYENGKLERTLLCNEKEILLQDYTDPNGSTIVKDGKGYFKGRVNCSANNFYNTINASGKITDGRPDSTWTSEYGNTNYVNEIFIKGKFFGGIAPKSKFAEQKKYTNESVLNNLFPAIYFAELDKFKIVSCPDTSHYSRNSNRISSYSFDFDKFKSFAFGEIQRVDDFNARYQKFNTDYVMEDNKFIISFSVNNDGIPENIKKVSTWGEDYFQPIKQVMVKFVRFAPNDATLYFHLNVTANAGNSLTYQIYFSKNIDD
jgi:hypothetical protein